MTTPSLEATSAAYFAGLFDGEGYVNIYVPKGRNTAVLFVGIGSTDFAILELLKRTFGGCLTKIRISSVASKRVSREWKITNDGAADFLRAVYPYLQIKKRQAALAFKFRKVMDQKLLAKDAHRLSLIESIACEIRQTNKGLLPGVETVKAAPEMGKSQSNLPA